MPIIRQKVIFVKNFKWVFPLRKADIIPKGTTSPFTTIGKFEIAS